MADQIITLPPDSTGKNLDTEELTVGANTVQRERHQISGAVAAEIARVLNTDPAAADYGLTTRELGPVSPQTSTGSVAAVAPAASGTVDSTQIGGGNTGKLWRLEAASSVPIKVEIQTVLNAVATTRAVRFGWDGNAVYEAPHKEFITQAENAAAGFDGFRAVITNLTTGAGLAADVYATFYWDEV